MTEALMWVANLSDGWHTPMEMARRSMLNPALIIEAITRLRREAVLR